AAVGLWFLSGPIMSVIYGHGRFTAVDTGESARVLQFYALGLVGYSGIKVLSPAFYAIGHKWTPMLVSFGSIALNIAMNWTLIFHAHFGPRGLALSTAVAATANFLVLYALMQRSEGTLATARLLDTLLRCGVAASALGAACWAATTWLHDGLFGAAFPLRVATLLAVVGPAGAIYVGLCVALRVEATSDAINAVRRKLRRRRN
ncbi:MAG: lipid II flippase MurJ, partial [Terrimicrobiaceae bacterium]|nr:lipid II flippase MurJ [Terrimicrobiaceae bacterium]